MDRLGYKSIMNPFVLLFLIFLISLLAGYKGVESVFLTFMLYFLVSFGNTLLHIKRSRYTYFFVYIELLFLLIFILPIMYIFTIHPWMISFAALGLTDLIIHILLVFYSQKEGCDVKKLWGDKFICSERLWFSQFSPKVHKFKDFETVIIDPKKNSLTRNLSFNRLFSVKLDKSMINHQFGGNDVFVFHLLGFVGNYNNEMNSKNGVQKDNTLIEKLRSLDNSIPVETAYYWNESFGLRISIKKNFVLKNPEKVYNFLKKAKAIDNKKVLIVSTRFPPWVGGTPTLFYNICKQFNPENIFVLTENRLKEDKEFDKKQKFKIYRTKKLVFDESKNSLIDDLKTYYRSYKKIKEIIKKEEIDVVVFEQFLNAFPLSFSSFPYYVYCHGEEMGSDLGKAVKIMKQITLRRAKGLIAVSDYTKKIIEKYNKNTKTIYNAVDIKTFYPKEKNKDMVKKYELEDKKVLMTISRLEKRKNHESVIRLMPKLLKKYDVKYLILGEGDEKENLKDIVSELKLENHVEFLGKVSQDELNDYYNLCDIFVMPNIDINGDTEGFGIVFLEANACGKPVIGGDKGGVTSAIKNGYNGFLVDGRDEEEIYNKISLLLEDDDLRKNMGKDALDWAKRFSYDKIYKNLYSFLESNHI
ncbi:glycosyltransferase [Candidatus Woesearchaeota archaeon]|nr:glycosyltransferase [Candidatus Woesearchaeota archaeon]